MIDFDSLDTLMYMCEAVDPRQPEDVQNIEPLDPQRFKAFVKSPDELDEDVINDIVAVIDGKLNVNPPQNNGTVPVAVPSTTDRVLNSTAIVYITDNDIPVAVATLIDPTVESYRGFVPLSHYSLESGYNLDGRVQQEFFAVADEYRGRGLGKELKAQIANLGIPTFILVDTCDTNSIEGVASNGYKLVCEMDDGVDNPRVQLWIDSDERETPENNIV